MKRKKKESYNYFKEFILMTDYIVDSAKTLKDIMENFDKEKLETDIVKVHNLENDADDIVHKMREYLIKDFLPPIDREDVTKIINRLDDLEDNIDEVLINIKIRDITHIKHDVMELIDILLKCTEAVREIFLDFNNFKNIDLIKEKTINVNHLEGDGDEAYERLMTALYKNEKDPIDLIKWTNIFNCLEDAIDSCELIADCVDEVVMKNS